MRKFKFSIDGIAEEIVEFEDDVKEKEVNKAFENWILDEMYVSCSCMELIDYDD